jgi:hypothetical protein
MSFIYSFINQRLCSPLLGPGLSFILEIFFTQTVGILGRVISLCQGRYLHTGQHKYRINANTNIHALSGIRTHDPRVRASEDSSCLRPRGQCDLPVIIFLICIVGGGIKVHSTLRPLNGLLCQPRVIMIMEKSVE